MNDDQNTGMGQPARITALMSLGSWKWVVTVWSYYVLLHLIPVEILTKPPVDNVWSFLVVQTIVSAYLGWKSRETILLDVFLAGMLYMIIFDRLHPTPPAVQSVMGYGVRALSYVIIASLGVIGAILGRFVQLRRSHSSVKSAST